MIIEALVILCLAAILGLTLTYSAVLAMQTRTRSIHDSIATQLALERLEELSATDPATLSSASNSTTTVYQNDVAFTRIVTVTVNSNGSRTVAIAVSDNNDRIGGDAQISDTFPLWGSL